MGTLVTTVLEAQEVRAAKLFARVNGRQHDWDQPALGPAWRVLQTSQISRATSA